MDDLIDKMAKLIIEQNSMSIGEDIAERAVKKINEEKQNRKNKEGGTKEDVKEKTKRRATKTA